MKYDEIQIVKYNIEVNIEYGIIKGNNDVFLIKTGLNGNIYGYENKYIKMARKINDTLGASVIVSSSLSNINEENLLEADMNYIKSKFDVDEIYAFGFSKGAYILLSYAHKYKEIKRVMGVNPPLMYNLHIIIEGIRKFNKESLFLIATSLDPTYKYLDLVKEIKNKKMKIIELKNIDHEFSGYIDEFISLPFKYMIDKNKEV